jgi:hypothetical protein
LNVVIFWRGPRCSDSIAYFASSTSGLYYPVPKSRRVRRAPYLSRVATGLNVIIRRDVLLAAEREIYKSSQRIEGYANKE